MCCCKQIHFVGAPDQRDHVASGCQLLRAAALRDEILQSGVAVGFARAVSVFRECADIPKLTCQHLKLRRIIECFKLLKGSKHIRCTNANAVVLQERDIAPRFKHLSNFHAELLAAWNRIGRKFYVSAYVSYRRDQVKVWEIADNGKRYKRRRVRVLQRTVDRGGADLERALFFQPGADLCRRPVEVSQQEMDRVAQVGIRAQQVRADVAFAPGLLRERRGFRVVKDG